MKKDFVVRRSIEMFDGIPHVCTISDRELIKCKACEYSYLGGEEHKHFLCEKHPELGEIKEDWYCADAWKP